MFCPRLKRALATLVVGALVFAAPAGAATAEVHAQTRSTIVAPGAAWPYQRWVNRALVPTVAGTVTVSADVSPCEGREACLLAGRDIRLNPGTNAYTQRTMLLHELGHVFDEERLTDAIRAEFSALFGLTEEWHPSRVAEAWETGPPFELFAQAYALCGLVANRDEVREWESVYGYWPTRAEHRAVCGIILRAV